MGPGRRLSDEMCESLRAKCCENAWLKPASSADGDEDGHAPLVLNLQFATSVDEVKDYLTRSRHHIRDGVVIDDVALIQQVDLGDEWWTLKRDERGAWHEFESLSFAPMMKNGAFDAYISSLLSDSRIRHLQKATTEDLTLADRAAMARSRQASPVCGTRKADERPTR